MAYRTPQIVGVRPPKQCGGRISHIAYRKPHISNKKDEIIFIVGATAIGKTAVAVKLTKKLNAEIISCDSMQVYKGMDILTSKPSLAVRNKVKHHLIDIISPTKEYNVSRYRKEAVRKIKEILNKGKMPFVVGGTGLYMSILIDGIFKIKPKQGIRLRLYKEVSKFGVEYLYKKLQNVDPQATLKIHPHDAKRIIRALEVFKSTGKPISYLQKQRKGLSDKYAIKIFCLNMEQTKLYRRIEERVDEMFEKGLVNEVRELLKLKLSKTAGYAIGIKELKGYFDGLYDLEEAKRMIKHNSCLYAKRQLTWFKKDKRIDWINIDDKDKAVDIANKILCQKELY